MDSSTIELTTWVRVMYLFIYFWSPEQDLELLDVADLVLYEFISTEPSLL